MTAPSLSSAVRERLPDEIAPSSDASQPGTQLSDVVDISALDMATIDEREGLDELSPPDEIA